MKKLIFLLLIFSLFVTKVLAAENKCTVTVTRDAAWQKFDITINMLEAGTSHSDNTPILSFVFKKEALSQPVENTNTQTFDCGRHQQFQFIAKFEPAIWYDAEHNPIGNTTESKKIYDITNQMMNKKDDTNLDIKINFPQDFTLEEQPDLLGN